MGKVVKNVTNQGSQRGTANQGAGDILGSLGSGVLGSILGGAIGGGVGTKAGGASGGLRGGGIGALLPALLPSLLNMLGSQSGPGKTGLQQVLNGMHAQGLGDIARSWVGTGQNQSISPSQAADAVGPDLLSRLSAETGLPPDQVSQSLAAVLPDLVNHLTPDGTVPSATQLRDAIEGLRGGLPRR